MEKPSDKFSWHYSKTDIQSESLANILLILKFMACLPFSANYENENNKKYLKWVSYMMRCYTCYHYTGVIRLPNNI